MIYPGSNILAAVEAFERIAVRRLFCFLSDAGTLFCLPRRVWKEFATVVFGLLLIVPASGQPASPAVSCESLAKLVLPHTTITMARAVAAGEFKAPSVGEPGGPEAGMPEVFGPVDASHHPAFCRVAAILKPSGDSNIKIEVWLPLSGWNGKFLGAGNLSWAGWIMYDGLLYGLQNGYAAASTDTGHELSYDFGRFVMGHPDKEVDYAYRSVHEMTVKAKAIITAFYDVAPRRSYWVGCSLGGQQGMTESQRFPDDYDGIVVGSPANPITHLNAADFWPAYLLNKNPSGVIPASKSTMIHAAVLKACDELDGVKDGILENPEACHFNPQVLLCKGADGPDCLTVPQVEYLRLIFAGTVNPRTKEQIYPPTALGAVENMLGRGYLNQHAIGLFRYMVFQDPNWDWKTLNFDGDINFADKALVTLNLPVSPNLKPFFDHGGKLLMYHGWTDGSSPRASIDYYNAVAKTVGAEVSNSMRVFAIPGMNHCSGGIGCDTFDKLDVIDHWVETGKAPDRIDASKLSGGKVVRTHPLCAYPMVAKYKGAGSTDDAENFVCAKQ